MRLEDRSDAVIEVDAEVEEALRAAAPVVALETTLVAHGFPFPEGATVAVESERRVRAAGAVPATVGVVDGAIRVGLAEAELDRFAAAGAQARKLGPRDLAACLVQGALGATTVGSTLAVCGLTGIRFMGTGGLGGVHRGFPFPPDVSADLGELTRADVLIVASGVKSILDVPATAEVLETLGVPVLGWRTDELPRFYVATGGPPVAARVESAAEAAQIARAHWLELRRAGAILLGRPPAESLDDVEPLIEEAVAAAGSAGVSGQAVTPFVLAYLHEHSGGRTARVNKHLIVDNAGLAAEVAVAYAEEAGEPGSSARRMAGAPPDLGSGR
jgi:pseudouridylate synthase